MANTHGFHVGPMWVLWEASTWVPRGNCYQCAPLVAAHLWSMRGILVGHSWGPWNFAIWVAYWRMDTTWGRTVQVRVTLLPHSTTNFTNYYCCTVLVSSHTSSILWWHISDRHLLQFLQQPWDADTTLFCWHHQYHLWPCIKECNTCLQVVSFRYIKTTVVHCKSKPNIKMIQLWIMFLCVLAKYHLYFCQNMEQS